MEAKVNRHPTGAFLMNLDTSKSNVGSTDRMIRFAVGVLILLGAFRGGSWAAGLIGAVVIGTAYMRFCPAYAFLGFSSNKDDATVAK
jgi:hypothetical protein